MQQKLMELKQRLTEIHDLDHAASVLGWDQMTYMPAKGAEIRGRQLATLEKLAHEKFTDPALGDLLDELADETANLDYDSDTASLIRVTKRLYDRRVRVPAEFAAEFAMHGSVTTQVWREARYKDDFATLRPYLEKTLEYSRQYADFFEHDHVMDPLIDDYDYGVTTAILTDLFADLREQQGQIYQAIIAQSPADDTCIKQHFPKEGQLEVGMRFARGFGYDTERGRLDLVPHPFETKLNINDVRITTRVYQKGMEGIFSTMHEAGHALYEQGVNPEFDGTPLDRGTSAGVHESQSRLWENVVGRSRGFWEFAYPTLQETFEGQLSDVSLDEFYRAINKVQPSLIRTDADEVSYNFHVMIRFDLEKRMLEGDLSVKDVPEAWHAMYQQYLGVSAPSDTNGCMQDIHWNMGMIGGSFQGYLLGNVLGAQYYNAALEAHPEIPDEIRQGKFDTLRNWLTENIYRHGRKFTAVELTQRITGGDMTIAPYIEYLRTKYGELYSL